jgi:hypothetical protein
MYKVHVTTHYVYVHGTCNNSDPDQTSLHIWMHAVNSISTQIQKPKHYTLRNSIRYLRFSQRCSRGFKAPSTLLHRYKTFIAAYCLHLQGCQTIPYLSYCDAKTMQHTNRLPRTSPVYYTDFSERFILLWLPWRWRQKHPSKRSYLYTNLHGVISPKTERYLYSFRMDHIDISYHGDKWWEQERM